MKWSKLRACTKLGHLRHSLKQMSLVLGEERTIKNNNLNKAKLFIKQNYCLVKSIDCQMNH